MSSKKVLQYGDPRTVEITEEEASPELKCIFCGRHEVNSVEWGLFLKLDKIVTHHFCLLFSANVQQKGRDDEGIQAFLPADIKLELKRGSRLKCKFCKQKNATIGCNVKNCKYSYHYPCGYEKDCLFQFYGQFQSFCKKHRPRQKIPKDVADECSICLQHVLPEHAIWPPCCGNRGKRLFHRKCIMHFAKNAGYFFKCPLCNSKKPSFMDAMKENGVYLPEQDAAWETEPHAFEDLTAIHSMCNSKLCLCPNGRESSSEDKNWRIIRCGGCGGQGTHMKCADLKINSWKCEICLNVFLKSGSGEKTVNSDDSDSEENDDSDDSTVSSTSDSSDEPSSSDEDNVISDLPSDLPFVPIQIRKFQIESPPLVDPVFISPASEAPQKELTQGGEKKETDGSRLPSPSKPQQPKGISICNPTPITGTENVHVREQTEDEKAAEIKRDAALQKLLRPNKRVKRGEPRGRIRTHVPEAKKEEDNTSRPTVPPLVSIWNLPPIPKISARKQRSPTVATDIPNEEEPGIDNSSTNDVGRPKQFSKQLLMDQFLLRNTRDIPNCITPNYPGPSSINIFHGAHYSRNSTPSPSLLEIIPGPVSKRCGNPTAPNQSQSHLLSDIQGRLIKLANGESPRKKETGKLTHYPTSTCTSTSYDSESYFDASLQDGLPDLSPTKHPEDSTTENSEKNNNNIPKIKVKCVTLSSEGEDSDEEVVEITPTPSRDPEVQIVKEVVLEFGCPVSSALKSLMTLRSKGKRQKSVPLIDIENEEQNGVSSGRPGIVKTEPVWNQTDAYHASNYTAFHELPHDYWLNSNSMKLVNEKLQNLKTEPCHSVGSSWCIPSSNSFLKLAVPLSSGKFYTGPYLNPPGPNKEAEAQPTNVAGTAEAEPTKRLRLS